MLVNTCMLIYTYIFAMHTFIAITAFAVNIARDVVLPGQDIN